MKIKVVPPKMNELMSDVLDSALASAWNSPASAWAWDDLQVDPRFGPEVNLIMQRMFSQPPYSERGRDGILYLAGAGLRHDTLQPAQLERFLRYKRLVRVVYTGEHGKQATSLLAPMIVAADELPGSTIGCFSCEGTVLMRQIWRIRPKGAGVDLLNLEPLVVCPGLEMQTECHPITRQHLAEIGWQPGGEPCTLVVVSLNTKKRLERKKPMSLSFTIIKPPDLMTQANLDELFPPEAA